MLKLDVEGLVHGAAEDGIAWHTEGMIYRKLRKLPTGDGPREFLALMPSEEPASQIAIERMLHEYGMKDILERSWALSPHELIRRQGATVLLLNKAEGEPLHHRAAAPERLAQFLRTAIAVATAVGRMHATGIVHRDLKPQHIVFDEATGQARLTGFGIATHIPLGSMGSASTPTISGTLPYMSPEQSGRIDHRIDSRSDLYSLGVTFYQMLTGKLPFSAAEPMEWIHCHIAKTARLPSAIDRQIPRTVSMIVMKLLAKAPEERYQTAVGLEHDLTRCLDAWETDRSIPEFVLGQADIRMRLPKPTKLYARSSAVATLQQAYRRAAVGGRPELVLISGYAGVGKSALVLEAAKAFVADGSLFAAGKFDQYTTNIPYASIAQALDGLVHQLLKLPEAELANWRAWIATALGRNGQLIVSLVPRLALIIGEQAVVSAADPKETQDRFHEALQSFLAVFARREQPLVLFIDDLQWLDAATLDLLKSFARSPKLGHLLLIGAFRDNEGVSGDLMADDIQLLKRKGLSVVEVNLVALSPADVAHMVADMLGSDPEGVRTLSDLVWKKTGGNPFFTAQFVEELAQEGLLFFNTGKSAWIWSVDRIKSKEISDNVADLMTTKMKRLRGATRKLLGQMAGLGAATETQILTAVNGIREEQLVTSLQQAVDAGLLRRSESSYHFVHDRVREAAYTLVPPVARAALHLKLAQGMQANLCLDQRDDRLFEIVNQFGLGRSCIKSASLKLDVARLSLLAGKRAGTAGAYASALQYFRLGREVLPRGSWTSSYELAFDLERSIAECEFVTGELDACEGRLRSLKRRVRTTAEEAEALCLEILVHFTAGRHELAIESGMAFLGANGTALLPDAGDSDVSLEYDRLKRNLEGAPIGDFGSHPPMIDARHLAAMKVLIEVHPAAATAPSRSRALADLIILRMTNLSLEQGTSDASSIAYSALSLFLGPRFDDYPTAYQFGKLAAELADRNGSERTRARVHAQVGSFALPWFESFSACQASLRQAYAAGRSSGDKAFAAYTLRNLLTNLFVSGMNLERLQEEADDAHAYTGEAGFGKIASRFVGHRRLIAILRGKGADVLPSEDSWPQDDLEHQQGLAQMASYHWTFMVAEHFFAEDYVDGLAAVAAAEPIRWAMHAGLEAVILDFYGALCGAALCPGSEGALRERCLERIRGHAVRISGWAANCPENFGDIEALVLAELARLEGRDGDAQRLYEQAIGQAHEKGRIQNEAVAYELAGRFYRDRGLGRIARIYTDDARSCYWRWGAQAKVALLDRSFGRQQRNPRSDSNHRSINTRVESLDLATVLKISQTISGELVHGNLITRLMRLALEHAGADRGVLVLPSGGEYWVEAEASISDEAVKVERARTMFSDAYLPSSILQYVVRTNETVLIQDAAAEEPLSSGSFLLAEGVRSALCVPLVNQGRLVGLIYLENRLIARAFSRDHVAIVKMIASQAAISLENIRLYDHLREREAKVRRLVDSNIIGIFIWDVDGTIVEANDAFLRIVGYNRDEIAGARVRWKDLTPPDWLPADERALRDLDRCGVAAPFEKEFFHRDGSRVPVLIGCALFDGTASQGVAFVLDLAERYKAEHAARENARRYHDLQLQLVHANRLATLGHLSASIAHELNQPLAGIMTNAGTCLAMLADSNPNLSGASDTARRTIRDAKRASDVINRLRSLFGRTSCRPSLVDLNEIAQEVVDLCSHDFMRSGVSVDVDLQPYLPPVAGDRIQLQQVILNLLQNAADAVASPNGYSRTISMRTETDAKGMVYLHVQDAGPGFPPELAENLFDAFYTTKDQGMGIGLSVSRSIIDRHQGRIWAKLNDGPGATFTLRIPSVDPSDADKALDLILQPAACKHGPP